MSPGRRRSPPVLPPAVLAACLAALAAPLAAPAQAGPPAPATPAEAPSPVGEKREAPTAEQVALRDQGVLLRRGQVTAELAAVHGRAERDYGATQVEQRLTAVEAALRLGVWDDVQVSARLPWRSQRTRAFSPAPSPDLSAERSAFGDLSVGAFGVAVREGRHWPNVIVSLDGVLPTGPGDAAVGGSVALTRSHDPVVLFAGVSYLRGLDVDATDVDRTVAEDNVAFNVGYAFAVNEAVALNGQLVGSWRSYPASLEPHQSRERYRLQLGLTWLVTRGLFLEPSVAVAVGSASPDLTIGLSVPWTF